MEEIGVIISLFIFVVLLRNLFFTLFASLSSSKKDKHELDYKQNKQYMDDEYVQAQQPDNHGIIDEYSTNQHHPELVKDEQCGKFIKKNKAYIVVIDGKRHYFCSWDCRQKFIQAS